MTHNEKADRFRALHQGPRAFVIAVALIGIALPLAAVGVARMLRLRTA